MRAFAFSFVSVTLVSLALNTACGSKSDDSDEVAATTTTSSYTYTANTKAIIDANCTASGCHAAGSVNKPMTTLAEIKAVTAAKMITRIKADDSTRMPKNNTTFETSDAGVMLLDWLAGGSDLK
ncbi:MAG TPA: hypothetical protein VE954_19275 [Oligoflexus sp.]|uniref:hypothetical protein n=1 Tax=Oligoflexus sp. TaxID=1971216 RepID=UPI002D6187C8|nr:hypothetical protein [Oligoflexus sp.]HYX35243.1 hypothetical protein [Oligoflexus sp.]